ncbi:hypothetical protein VNO77_11119 [Canavalia gladiata]|uniref:Uncharacterized protein n=1 Tax=Canavalia gladiata TaxID=3824 RepID=A0AAN9MB55_CANGL
MPLFVTQIILYSVNWDVLFDVHILWSLQNKQSNGCVRELVHLCCSTWMLRVKTEVLPFLKDEQNFTSCVRGMEVTWYGCPGHTRSQISTAWVQ